MTTGSIAAALIAEHHEIDAGIEKFVAQIEELGASPGGEQVRDAASALLGAFTALRRHIYLEEEFVFPALDDPSLKMALMVMYREHGTIWRLMDQAEAEIGEPGAAANQVVATCEQMLGELEKHNAKEEPIIYPHTDADLSEAQQARLAEFLESGQLPAGWKCREASAGGERKLPF